MTTHQKSKKLIIHHSAISQEILLSFESEQETEGFRLH